MGKHKSNQLDGATEKESKAWGNTKGIEWMRKQNGNRVDGEAQRELNGWGNTKENIRIGEK